MCAEIASDVISVIIPVYNVEKYVGEAIRSVLDQSYKNFELIVVNDCSPDASSEVVRSFSDPRIRLISHETNRGVAHARNSGIAAATGKFIAFLDSDDVMTPQRLAKQLRFMKANPDIALSTGACRTLSQNKNDKSNGLVHKGHIDPRAVNAALVFGNIFATSTLMMRREAMPSEGFRQQYAEDYDLLVRISLERRFAILSDVFVEYRLRSDSAMQSIKLEQKKQDVWRSQRILFDLLQISPTPEEKEIHLFARTHTGNVDRDRLITLYAWYMKLIEANVRARVYAEEPFRLAASYMWFEHLYRATGCGIKALEMLLGRRLSLHHPQPFSRIAKVFIKSALRRDFKRH